jgi:integrase
LRTVKGLGRTKTSLVQQRPIERAGVLLVALHARRHSSLGVSLMWQSASRLAEASCSAPVIASISGHASLREVQRYVEAAEQTLLAHKAIEAVTRTKAGKLQG